MVENKKKTFGLQDRDIRLGVGDLQLLKIKKTHLDFFGRLNDQFAADNADTN